MLPHRQSRASAFLLVLLPCFVSGGRSDDLPASTYHTSVSEVRITFFATGPSNRPVETISKDDFAIVDNDQVVRDFRSLARSHETALDVVVLVDTSGSIAPRLQTSLNEVLVLALQKQIIPDDNISILSFAGLQPALLCTRDCRSSGAQQKLLSVKASGLTPLFDAVTYGANFLARRQAPGVRPVLLLFSDGEDNISKTSGRDALQSVIASGAMLYAVDLNQSSVSPPGSATLQRMAEATGGRYFSSQTGAATVVQTALEDLQASYVVTYRLPSAAAGFHSIRILPKPNLNLRFHCRSGYYYGTSMP